MVGPVLKVSLLGSTLGLFGGNTDNLGRKSLLDMFQGSGRCYEYPRITKQQGANERKRAQKT